MPATIEAGLCAAAMAIFSRYTDQMPMYIACDINCPDLKYALKCKSRTTSDRHSATPSL